MLAALVSRTCRREMGALATSVTQAAAGAPAGSTRLALPMGWFKALSAMKSKLAPGRSTSDGRLLLPVTTASPTDR